MDIIKIGLVSISDRASKGIYKDEGIPKLKEFLLNTIENEITFFEHLIPDNQQEIEKILINLTDNDNCAIIFTTGGTGPYPSDVTPEATLNVADRIIPGFGEQMRQISLNFVPTAILSRQVGVIRKKTLILNLPGRPKAIKETLGGLTDQQGKTIVYGIFASIPVCVDAIGGPDIIVKPGVDIGECKSSKKDSNHRS